MGPHLKYLPMGSFYLFMLSVFFFFFFFFFFFYFIQCSHFSTRRFETANFGTFFPTEICDLRRPANQNNHRLHMTKHHCYIYEPMEGNTVIVIFMPTNKYSLAAAGSRFLPAFDGSFNVVKWSL